MIKKVGFTQEEVQAATTALVLRLVRAQMTAKEAAAFIKETADQMRDGAKSRVHKGGADWLEHSLLPGIK